jgi:hypothetical protein
MTIADDVVALRSFPRRYRENVVGVRDDDAWDRLVRTVPAGKRRSALGWVAHSTDALRALADAVTALPHEAHPSLALGAIASAPSEPAPAVTIDEVLAGLTAAAARAADAVDARSSADWDREISVDGRNRPARDVLDTVVQAVARHLRDVDEAIEAARAGR